MILGPGPLTAVGISIETQRKIREDYNSYSNEPVIKNTFIKTLFQKKTKEKEYPKPKEYKVIKYL